VERNRSTWWWWWCWWCKIKHKKKRSM